ncbi:MAG: pyridoxal-phosphate dependent enzyme [bacterium]
MKFPGKIKLANLPTPLQLTKFNGCSFYIKRDDLTGVELTGNKVRKLEYLLFDAKKKKANYVFTTGGEQSNHSRATALAAASIGIKSKLFLWGSKKKSSTGNLLLDEIAGAEIIYMNRIQFDDVRNIMLAEKEKFELQGKKVYIIPEGGSSPLGIWGYISFFDEIQDQIDDRKVNGIFTSAGSGGTSAGLLIGNALFGLNVKIFAVNVLFPKKVLLDRIEILISDFCRKYKIKQKIDTSDLEILDGYSTEGYKNIAAEKISVIKNFARQSGIIFDPAYTGKAFYAYDELFLKNRKRSKVLFIHTGGIFGVFEKSKEYLLG